MVLLMLPCHRLVWLLLVWRNWMVSRVLLCSWARTAMNCYCSFFTACWWWSGRFGWHHQLFLPICSSLCYCPGLTHRPTHCWWLGQSAWLLSMQWTLWAMCVLEVETWAHNCSTMVWLMFISLWHGFGHWLVALPLVIVTILACFLCVCMFKTTIDPGTRRSRLVV
jgi:hypothetical protein